MVFDSLGLINLVLYCMQQLGVALGLGAQTIMLVAYISAIKDGAIDGVEAQFLRATRATLWVALALMIISGAVITAIHFLAGQGATVLTSAYLFKILLIAVVVVLTALLHTLPETFAEGLLGGTWYALFLVHILAPVTSWANLLTLWAVWLVGFNLLWYVIVFSTRERKIKPAVISSEAAILKKAAPPQPPSTLAPAKPPRRPFFSFLHKQDTPKAESVPAVPVPMPVPASAPVAPAQFKPIVLDPVPKSVPVLVPQAPVPAPAAAQVPATPPMPAQQIKLDPPVAARPPMPVEKMPAGIATDTPFLPQVPPLQPIPTIPASPQTSSQGGLPTPPPAGIPHVPGSKEPPVLQKAEELPPISPEIKLGLNVMPKSPEQVQK